MLGSLDHFFPIWPAFQWICACRRLSSVRYQEECIYKWPSKQPWMRTCNVEMCSLWFELWFSFIMSSNSHSEFQTNILLLSNPMAQRLPYAPSKMSPWSPYAAGRRNDGSFKRWLPGTPTRNADAYKILRIFLHISFRTFLTIHSNVKEMWSHSGFLRRFCFFLIFFWCIWLVWMAISYMLSLAESCWISLKPELAWANIQHP